MDDKDVRTLGVSISIAEIAVIIIESMTNCQRPEGEDPQDLMQEVLENRRLGGLADSAVIASRRIAEYFAATMQATYALHRAGFK